MRYDNEKRIFMTKKWYELKNYTLVQRAWRSNFKNYRALEIGIIKRTVERFEATGSVASLPTLQATPSQKREDAKDQLKILFSANVYRSEKLQPTSESAMAWCRVFSRKTFI